MKRILIFLFMVTLFMTLVACSYNGRNAQIIYTQWDNNTETGKYFIIDSVDELNEYIDINNEQRLSNNVEGFAKSFFEDSSLVIVLVSEGSGCVSHKIKSIKVNEDIIDITVKRNVPELGTFDMSECTIIFEVTKEEASNIKDVNLILK